MWRQRLSDYVGWPFQLCIPTLWGDCPSKTIVIAINVVEGVKADLSSRLETQPKYRPSLPRIRQPLLGRRTTRQLNP